MSKKNVDMGVLAIIIIFLFSLFSALSPSKFLSFDNLQSMAFQLPELGILSLGMMITMVSGGINLSLIANANLLGVATMLCYAQTSAGHAAFHVMLPFLPSLAIGLALAVAVGILNGLLIAFLDVSPILATLGTMTFVAGVNIFLTRGYTLSGVPSAVLFLGNGTLVGIPVPLIVFLICALVMALILGKTILGYRVYMFGSNPQVTKFSGINNRLVVMMVYLLSSLYAILAALIMMGRFNSAKADYGESYLLVTVLAGVLGGVDPSGGFGRILGVFLALIILQIISSGLNLLSVDPNLSIVIWGCILIAYMGIKLVSGAFRSRRSIQLLSREGGRL